MMKTTKNMNMTIITEKETSGEKAKEKAKEKANEKENVPSAEVTSLAHLSKEKEKEKEKENGETTSS